MLQYLGSTSTAEDQKNIRGDKLPVWNTRECARQSPPPSPVH